MSPCSTLSSMCLYLHFACKSPFIVKFSLCQASMQNFPKASNKFKVKLQVLVLDGCRTIQMYLMHVSNVSNLSTLKWLKWKLCYMYHAIIFFNGVKKKGGGGVAQKPTWPGLYLPVQLHFRSLSWLTRPRYTDLLSASQTHELTPMLGLFTQNFT